MTRGTKPEKILTGPLGQNILEDTRDLLRIRFTASNAATLMYRHASAPVLTVQNQEGLIELRRPTGQDAEGDPAILAGVISPSEPIPGPGQIPWKRSLEARLTRHLILAWEKMHRGALEQHIKNNCPRNSLLLKATKDAIEEMPWYERRKLTFSEPPLMAEICAAEAIETHGYDEPGVLAELWQHIRETAGEERLREAENKLGTQSINTCNMIGRGIWPGPAHLGLIDWALNMTSQPDHRSKEQFQESVISDMIKHGVNKKALAIAERMNLSHLRDMEAIREQPAAQSRNIAILINEIQKHRYRIRKGSINPQEAAQTIYKSLVRQNTNIRKAPNAGEILILTQYWEQN